MGVSKAFAPRQPRRRLRGVDVRLAEHLELLGVGRAEQLLPLGLGTAGLGRERVAKRAGRPQGV